MKLFQVLLLSLIITPAMFLLSSCLQSPDYKKLEQEVRDLNEYSVELFKQKDVDKLVDRFTKDGSIKITGAPLITGHDALRANYENTLNLQNFDISLDVKKIEISKSGDMAYAISEYNVSFDLPGNHIVDNGITVLVLIREGNKWKIATENLSSYPVEK